MSTNKIACEICGQSVTNGYMATHQRTNKKCQSLKQEREAAQVIATPVAVQQPVVEAVCEVIQEQPVVQAVFEQIEMSVSEECEIIVDEQSEQDQIKCSQCNDSITDFQGVMCVCKTCQAGTKTNCKPVVAKLQTEQLDLSQSLTVCDVKPIIGQYGKLQLFVPSDDQPNRVVDAESLKFQHPNGKTVNVPVQVYRHTIAHAKFVFYPRDENESECKQNISQSLWNGIEMSRDVAQYVIEHNPTVTNSKAFMMKMAIDYTHFNFKLDKYVTVYIDTETSACDGKYTEVPQPSNRANRLTIIQFLVDMQDGSRPKQYIYHMSGYTYDQQLLRQEFNDVDIVFQAFGREQVMIDAFWSILFELRKKHMVFVTGFNACHEIRRQTGSDGSENVVKFTGYDLNWLTARSEYRMTPSNAFVKLDVTTSAILSQIVELPNVVFVDFQALMIRGMAANQKAKNACEGQSLKALMQAYFGKDEINSINKVDQNIWQLQMLCHKQMFDNEERVDMTDIMRYSINDTVCLYRAERKLGFLANDLISVMNQCQIPLSMSTTVTVAQLDLVDINRFRLAKGLHYKTKSLTEQGSDKVTGAYTNADTAYIGKLTSFVIQNDFNSLYPTVIRRYNISQESRVYVGNEISAYQDSSRYAILNLSDDKRCRYNENQTFVVYDLTIQADLPKLCTALTEKRDEIRQEQKLVLAKFNETGDQQYKILYNRLESQQLLVKTKNNSIYGLCGAKDSNPYYCYITAASVTAGARHALACLNRGNHQLLGMKQLVAESQNEMPTDAMIRVKDQESANMIWTRNYFNQRDGFQSRICQNDTDAAFVDCSDAKFIQQSLTNPDQALQLYNSFNNELTQLVSQYIGRDGLGFACEEMILALFTSCAKKSYIRVDYNKKGWENTWPQVAQTMYRNGVPDIGATKQLIRDGAVNLVIKGVAWSQFDVLLRDKIRDLFLDIALSGIETINDKVLNLKSQLNNDFMAELNSHLNGQPNNLKAYAKRVRLSGKSLLVQTLSNKYKFEDTMAYVLPLRSQYRGQKKSELYIPIHAVNDKNQHRIDTTNLWANIDTQVKKFFDNTNTKTKQQRQDLLNDMQDDQVLIRVESNKQRHKYNILFTPDEVQQYVEQNRHQYVIHEVIALGKTKLFFDIDGQELDLGQFKRSVINTLKNNDMLSENAIEMYLSERRNTSIKYSYHITFNLVMDLHIVKQIAEQLHNIYESIDMAVYARGKTLRVTNSYKFNDKREIQQSALLTTDCDYKDTLVTYIEGYNTFETPLCFDDQDIIQFNYALQFIDMPIYSEQQQAVMQQITLHPEDLQQQQRYIKAKVNDGRLCPACNKKHSQDDPWKLSTYYSKQHFIIMCYKTRADGQQSICRIPLDQKQVDHIKNKLHEQKVNVNQTFATQFMSTMSKRHVDFKINNRLTFIKSNMGTGKTEVLIRELKTLLESKAAIMLSVRNTLSTEWMQRYARGGIEMVDYRAVTGCVKPVKGKVVVCQVDSIQRINNYENCVFICDELQSIIQQLDSSQIRDTTGVHTQFINMLQNASNVICMDANLHDSTINLIEQICGQSGQVIVNSHPTYRGTNVVLRKYRQSGLDHALDTYLSAVRAGKRVVGHVVSREACMRIREHIQTNLPNTRVMIYHGENLTMDTHDGVQMHHEKVKQIHFQDVHKYWSQYDVVLYTGTITAGVNFDMQHFDINISMYDHQTKATADQFIQGLMRCRQLNDKQIIIYFNTPDRQFRSSCLSTYRHYEANLNYFGFVSKGLFNPLFNLQVYLKAYMKMQQGRALDIIIASCNQMGMRVRYEDLSLEQQKAKKISSEIKIDSSRITQAFISEQKRDIDQRSVVYFQDRTQDEVIQTLADDLKLIQFYTTRNHQYLTSIQAFDDNVKLCEELNKIHKQTLDISADDLKQQVAEFQQYLIYKKFRMFQPDNGNIVNQSEEIVNKHIKCVLDQHNQAMAKGGISVKDVKKQSLDIAEQAQDVRNAYRFVRAHMLGADKQEVERLAKICGYPQEQNWCHIYTKVGLYFNRKVQQSKVSGKRVRDYTTTVNEFFKIEQFIV